MNRWSDQGFMPSKQLKGEPNWIEHWPTFVLTCFFGCLCQFLTSQKLRQHSGIIFPHRTNVWQKTREELSCMQDQSASLRLVHQATRMPNLLLTGSVCQTTCYRQLRHMDVLCGCEYVFVHKKKPLLCGHPMEEVVCQSSLHSSGYWLASWYAYHSVCF